jgi:hypothetical protein
MIGGPLNEFEKTVRNANETKCRQHDMPRGFSGIVDWSALLIDLGGIWMAHVRDGVRSRSTNCPSLRPLCLRELTPENSVDTANCVPQDRLIFLLEPFTGLKSKSSRASRRQLT